jgi:hypothetical protein
MNTMETAKLMIATIRAALANGVQHRHPVSGRKLTTEVQVLEALRSGVGVELDESARVEVTTPEAELAKMNARRGDRGSRSQT